MFVFLGRGGPGDVKNICSPFQVKFFIISVLMIGKRCVLKQTVNQQKNNNNILIIIFYSRMRVDEGNSLVFDVS